MKGTSGARPGTKIVIKGGTQKRNQAEEFKLQGNSYFTSLEYEKAIECYSKCLDAVKAKDLDLKKVVLSNRAQSYIKVRKYKEAETDAAAALQIDEAHIKSLQRRGTARYHLGKLKDALKDFKKALELENNSLMVDYMRKTENKLNKIRNEAYEQMKRRAKFIEIESREFKQMSEKVNIEEINQEQQMMVTEKKEENIQRQSMNKQE